MSSQIIDSLNEKILEKNKHIAAMQNVLDERAGRLLRFASDLDTAKACIAQLHSQNTDLRVKLEQAAEDEAGFRNDIDRLKRENARLNEMLSGVKEVA